MSNIVFDPICDKWVSTFECCYTGGKVLVRHEYGADKVTIKTTEYILEDGSISATPPAGLDCTCSAGGGGGGDATAANQTLQIAEAVDLNEALTSIGTDSLRVDLIDIGSVATEATQANNYTELQNANATLVAIDADQATAANQTSQIAEAQSLNEALTSIGTDSLDVSIVAGGGGVNATTYDGAGRIEVSQSTSVGDYVLTQDLLPDYFFDRSNDGSTTWNATKNGALIAAADSGGGNAYSRFRTKQRHPYFAGHAQQAEFTLSDFTTLAATNVYKRAGYYSADVIPNIDMTSATGGSYDGAFIQSVNGVITFEVWRGGVNQASIPYANWNVADVVWDSFNVFLIDFLYLGGTSVKLYMIYNGAKVLVAEYHNSNNSDDTVMITPNQPISMEVVTEAVLGADEFYFYCANVGTLGTFDGTFGTPVEIATSDIYSMATAGTKYAILGLRKTSELAELFVQEASIAVAGGATEMFLWEIQINPTVDYGGGSAFSTSYAIPNQWVEYERSQENGIGTNITTDGIVIASGVGNSRNGLSGEISKALRLGVDGSYVQDIVYLVVMPYSNTQDVVATLGGIVV